jgi:hypothetical protein
VLLGEIDAMTHSTRLTAAMIGLVLLAAPALALLAYRNVETSILLAGLAAIMGVVVATVLMADALTRPLVEMADAVTTLARARTAEIVSNAQHTNDAQHTNVVALQPYAQRKRAEPGEPKTGNKTGQKTGQVVGSTIDFVIPSDRRERHR